MKAQGRVTRWLGVIGLTVMLVAGVVGLARQVRFMVVPVLPVARLWLDPDAQARATLGDVPYDLLQAAHAALPPDAAVLLVTNGHAVRQAEYITFHRALYYLAPRAVWWLSPAPSDGTWEARWWISAPLTAQSVTDVAAAHRATHVLAVGIDDSLLPGQRLLQTGDGYLLALGDDVRAAAPPERPVPAEPLSGPALAARLLLLVVGLGSILLWGWLVLLAARFLGHSTHGAEAWALAWALGAGVVALGMTALNGLGLALPQQIGLLTVVGVVLGAAQLSRRTRHPSRRARPGSSGGTQAAVRRRRDRVPGQALSLILLGLFLFQLGVVVLLAVGQPLRVWDSWVTWGMKARVIFLEGGIAPAAFADPSRAITLPAYPLLVPLVEAWLFGWMGSLDDRLVGVVSVLWYLALGGVTYGTLRHLQVSRLYALTVTAVLLLVPGVATWAGTVMADVPLAVYTIITAVCLVRWIDGERPGVLFVAAVAAACMVWTKREGAILLACLLVVSVLLRVRSRRTWLSVLALGAAGLLVAIPWAWWTGRHSAPVYVYLPLTWETLRSSGDKVGPIVYALLGSLARSNWSYLWPLLAMAVLSALILRRQQPRHRSTTPHIWLLTALAYLTIMAGSYLVSAYAPLPAHLANSIDRVILPVVPLTGLWLAWWGIGYTGSSSTISGTAEPPPALTLSSDEVLSRTPPPSMSAPPQT